MTLKLFKSQIRKTRLRLPTLKGTVNGKKVKAFRDTDCTGCFVPIVELAF